jgi:hypothetical protein
MKIHKVGKHVTGLLFPENLRRAFYLGALLLALGLTAATTWGQEARATLEGRISDQHGGVIPKASIEVISEDTGLRQTTLSNTYGLWSVRFLNPGTYDVAITAQGFRTAEQKGITLQVADDKRIETVLSVGATQEVVSVTADAPLIDTSSATAGTVVEGATLSELPMESRISYLLAGLSPGVHLVPQNNNVAFMWSYNAASDVRVNGGRDRRSNEFLLDGMPNTHADAVAFIPPADSVAQFRVMANAYDAQYGRQAGATFNVELKSGTERFHGGIYEYYENASFNANRYEFNHAFPKIPRPVAHYNLYGGTFGGPVIFDRKKTFFFVSWEGIRNKDPRNNSPLSLPTLDERNGDFRNSFTTTVSGGVRTVFPINIYDPTTLSGNTRQQFVASSNPGDPRYNPACQAPAVTCLNVIPVARLDPIALNILKFIPTANNPNDGTGSSNGDYVPTAFRQNKMASTVLRLDHSFNDHNKTYATVRWNHEDEFLDDFFHNLTTGSFGTRINWGGGIDHVWTISPTQILDVRYNVTRFQEPTRPQGSGFDPAKLGFSSSFVGQMPEKSFPNITGVFSDKVGGGFGNYFDSTYHTWMASMTHTQGNMTWHYGVDYRVIQEARGDFGNQSGSFSFSNTWTRKVYNTNTGNGDGSSFATFLLGLPTGGSINRNATRFDSQHFYSFFFQNDWRLTPRLTLNMGMRWEYETPFTERFDRFTSVFDPTQVNPISDAAQAAYTNILNTMLANADPRVHSAALTLAQLVPATSYKVFGVQLFPGVNGQKRTVTNLDLHEWQPRAGLAFQLFKSTVIRGGVGRFVQSTNIRGGQNGFSRTTSILSSLDNGKHPFDTLDSPFINGIFAPTGSSLGPLTNLGLGVDWENPNPRRPYSWQYSFQIQHQLKSWLIEAGYSHQNTYDIQSSPGGLEQNDIGLSNWITYNTPIFDATGQPQFGPGGIDIGPYHLGNSFLATRIPNPFLGLSTNGVACVNPLPSTCVGGSRGSNTQISVYDLMRPLKLLGGTSINDNPKGRTHYDAFETKVQRRFANGYSFIASYTYSKLIEITSFLGPQLAGAQEHKIGGEDTPHKLSISSIYELPIGRDRRLFRTMPRALDAFIGGWELAGQYTFESGLPVVFGTDSFFDGHRPVLHGQDPSLSEWFDTSHFFKFPGPGDDISQWPSWTGVQNLPGGANCNPTGTAKNCVYADFANFIRTYPTRWTDVRVSRTNEVNLGIYKNFKLTEQWKAQLRGEAFNLLNHPRFGGPNTNPGSSQFGIVAPAQVNEARVVQFAFKLNF